MDKETRVLIEVRLDRSREDIETARELLQLRRYRAAVNRAYYAVFSITTALLLTKKIERSKHTGVESAFIPLTFLRSPLPRLFPQIEGEGRVRGHR